MFLSPDRGSLANLSGINQRLALQSEVTFVLTPALPTCKKTLYHFLFDYITKVALSFINTTARLSKPSQNAQIAGTALISSDAYDGHVFNLCPIPSSTHT